ncbi:hypothetical protein [Clostridium lundense]|uniref:hypothetical protein n=1 Tax=Clostridium lundense TaxID=319475 RepID=UPI00048527D2|nr:hypothetical protein [Clostridium lundense]
MSSLVKYYMLFVIRDKKYIIFIVNLILGLLIFNTLKGVNIQLRNRIFMIIIVLPLIHSDICYSGSFMLWDERKKDIRYLIITPIKKIKLLLVSNIFCLVNNFIKIILMSFPYVFSYGISKEYVINIIIVSFAAISIGNFFIYKNSKGMQFDIWKVSIHFSDSFNNRGILVNILIFLFTGILSLITSYINLLWIIPIMALYIYSVILFNKKLNDLPQFMEGM